MSYYSVRTKPARGIYTNWKDCKEAIDKCPKDIQVAYKKFETKKEANEFLNANCGENKRAKYRYSLYVDGSYDKNYKVASYAAILIDEKNKITLDKISGICDWEAKSWNIDGELAAVVKGLRLVISKGNIKNVNIFFDYEGIRSFAKGWYSTDNCLIARHYVNFLNSIKGKIDLHFVKVKSHSNNDLNDSVDIMAKKAIKQYKKKIKKANTKQDIVPTSEQNNTILYILANKINENVFVGTRNTTMTKDELLLDIKKRINPRNSLSKEILSIGIENIYIEEIREIPKLDSEEKKKLIGETLNSLGRKSMVEYQNKYVELI